MAFQMARTWSYAGESVITSYSIHYTKLYELFGCTLMAPHGGLFVLAIPNAVGHVAMYLAAIAAGTALTGVMYAVLKPGMEVQEA